MIWKTVGSEAVGAQPVVPGHGERVQVAKAFLGLAHRGRGGRLTIVRERRSPGNRAETCRDAAGFPALPSSE